MAIDYKRLCDELDRKIGISFKPGDPALLKRLKAWCVPESIIGFYRDFDPVEDRRDEVVHDVSLLCLHDVIFYSEDEHGALLLPHGLLTFGMTGFGDMLCVDLKKDSRTGDPSVVLVDHELSCTLEDHITPKMMREATKPFAKSFTEFLTRFLKGEIKV